jgi:hypothetical protein
MHEPEEQPYPVCVMDTCYTWMTPCSSQKLLCFDNRRGYLKNEESYHIFLLTKREGHSL